jgi:hypothetical protein
VLTSTGQVGVVRQAISDARREGYINSTEAQRLTRRVNGYVRSLETDTQQQDSGNR